MCILKISASDSVPDALAALAHNLDTIIGDLNQMRRILEVQHPEGLVEFSGISVRVESASSDAWNLWQHFVPACSADHSHDRDHEHV